MNIIVIGVIALVVGIMIVLVASAGLVKFMYSRSEADDRADSNEWREIKQPSVSEATPAAPEVATARELQGDELIAVIAAVLAAELNTSADGLVVRSVRRVSQWNGLAREGR